MLFVWPRFLGLFETRKVIFVYIILVKTKEKICLVKLLDYAGYVKITRMVLPKGWVPLLSLNTSATSARFGVCVAIYAAAMTIATFAAQGLRIYAITNHNTYEAENAVYLSTVTIREKYLTKVEKIALNAPQAQPVHDALRGAILLNYVMPIGMYVSEIPMHLPENETFGHTVPDDWDSSKYKVSFTGAAFDGAGLSEGGAILTHTVNKFSNMEIWVDISRGDISKGDVIEHTLPRMCRSITTVRYHF